MEPSGPTDEPFSMFTEWPVVAPYLSTGCDECDWTFSSSSYAALINAKVAHKWVHY